MSFVDSRDCIQFFSKLKFKYCDIKSSLFTPAFVAIRSILPSRKSNFLFRGEDKVVSMLSEGAMGWAYGISGSGLKLNETDYKKDSYVALTKDENYHNENLSYVQRKTIMRVIDEIEYVDNLYHYSMLFSELNDTLYGYVISPSKLSQMHDIIKFRNRLNEAEFDVNYIKKLLND